MSSTRNTYPLGDRKFIWSKLGRVRIWNQKRGWGERYPCPQHEKLTLWAIEKTTTETHVSFGLEEGPGTVSKFLVFYKRPRDQNDQNKYNATKPV